MRSVLGLPQFTVLRESPGCSAGREPTRAWAPWVGSLERQRQLEFTRVDSTAKRKLHKREIWRSAEGSPWVFRGILTVCKDYRRSGKELQERIRKDSIRPSQRVRNSERLFPQPDWISSRLTGHWLEYSEGCCLSRGNIAPTLKTALASPSKS